MAKSKLKIGIVTAAGIILFTFLFLNLYKNYWGIIPNVWFEDWNAPTDYSETLVIASLKGARQYGFGYNYGLMGGYVKQIGLQGILLRIVDLAFRSQDLPLDVFRGGFVSAFCILILYFMYWSWTEFGIGAAIGLYLGTFFNSWIIASCHNLYWAGFTFLIPFLWMLAFSRKDERSIKKHSLKKYFLISFLTIFIRAACGFEMISAVMVSAEVPIIYYALKNKWDKKLFYKRFIAIAGGAFAAFIATLFVNLMQQTLYFSSISEAIKNLVYTVSKRTGIFEISVAPIFQESLEASKLSVLYRYFTDGKPLLGNFHMNVISLFFVIVTVSCFIGSQYSVTIERNRRKLQALGGALWISFLGPLSWYILAAPHSYIHTSINYFLWSYPFLLIGCMLCGCIISMLFFDWKVQIKRSCKIWLPTLALILLYFHMDNYKVGERYLKIVPENGILVESNSYINLYYYDNCLYYMAPVGNQEMPFFLHFYADDPQEFFVNQYGFINNDFHFNDQELKTYAWEDTKIARVSLNKEYKVDSISTGQYDELGQKWECEFSLLDVITPPKTLTPYDMSDNHWINGISNDGTCILTDSYDMSLIYLKNKLLKTVSGEKVKVLNVEKQGNWYHFILDKAVNPSDGYPNHFEVTDE